MGQLSAAEEVPLNRLLWLCEGLALASPDVKEYKRAVSIVKGTKKLLMAGEPYLASLALESVGNYTVGLIGGDAIDRRVAPVNEALLRRIGERS
jgi:hypothetical protein